MDLENELRQAMAEHVTGVSAPRTLADEAKRRHHRTVRRRTTVAAAAAGVVVAVAMVPTYQAIRPQPVGAPGPGGRPGGGAKAGAATTAQPSTPSAVGPAATSKTTAGTSHPAAPPSRHSPGTHSAVSGIARSLLGYVPAGIRPDGKCDTEEAGHRRTTVCRWTGSAGWVEVRLVRDGGLAGPADMGLAPPMPKHVQVNGHTALQGDGPTMVSQIMWIEHSGLGVWVGVSPGLGGSLLRVADGVHIS